jgi:hypothetical protein
MSFLVTRQGITELELEAWLQCQGCHRPVLAREAWIAFPALAQDDDQQPAIVVHRRCLDTHTMFGKTHVTLWRASDFLERCLRPSSDDLMTQVLAQRERRYKPWEVLKQR